MIEVRAKRRKYKFNVIDYLWYMGKDSWRVPLSRWPSPFEAVANSLIVFPMLMGGFILGSMSSKYGVAIFISFFIGMFIMMFSYNGFLKKHRFTPERERAYFRRYPERKHYSIRTLFWFPVTVYVVYLIIFGTVFFYFLNWIN